MSDGVRDDGVHTRRSARHHLSASKEHKRQTNQTGETQTHEAAAVASFLCSFHRTGRPSVAIRFRAGRVSSAEEPSPPPATAAG